MHESGSFCSPKRAAMVISHSSNIPYALAFKPLRILPLPSHLLSPPPPPDLCCWSGSILIENSSPCVLFQFWSCLRLQSEMLLWQKHLMEVKRSLPHTLISFFPILPIYLHLSSLGSAQSKLSHQKPVHFLLDRGSWFTLKLHNPSTWWCKEENRDTRGSGDMNTEGLPSLVAAHSCTRLSAAWTALGEEHVDHSLSTGENTIL